MIDIGIVGLDTSHGEAFAETIRELPGMTVVGVWDGGDVRDDQYVEAFCDKYDTRRFTSVEDLTDYVDAAMVLTVDWETHSSLAIPFLEVGVPVLIDKPIAGNLAHLKALRTACKSNTDAALFGGSAVPFHDQFADLPRGGDDRTIYAAGYNDFFYYRVHVTDTIRSLANDDWVEVVPSAGPGTTVDIRFDNGIYATIRLDGSTENPTFGILDVAASTRAVELNVGRDTLGEMYGPYLRTFRDVVRGERDDTDRLLDAGSLLLAVETALETGRSVTPDSDALANTSIPAAEFVEAYDPYY